jgi:hypothetical protein
MNNVPRGVAVAMPGYEVLHSLVLIARSRRGSPRVVAAGRDLQMGPAR